MTKSTEMFFALLRLGINDNQSENYSALVNAEATDWEQLYALSVRQGTGLLAYGGMQYAPIEIQPPRKLKLRWCANVIKGSERFDHHKLTIAKLSDILAGSGIDMLVVKGVTTAMLYPVPSYREGGDIDIYLFGKAGQTDRLLSSIGINIEHHIAKHSTFVFDGLMVENHHTFFDTDIPFRRESLLYAKMEDMLTGMFSVNNCPSMNLGSARMLPPQAAALYMVGHTFRHFCCVDINVRQLCDWTVFFNKNKNEINAGIFADQVKELGLDDFVIGINSFCYTYLGLSPAYLHLQKRDRKSEQLIMKMVMNYRSTFKVHIPVIGVIKRLVFRNKLYNRYLARIRHSEFLNPELKSYFSYLVRRTKFSLNPKSSTEKTQVHQS